jgi:hypothetical protein
MPKVIFSLLISQVTEFIVLKCRHIAEFFSEFCVLSLLAALFLGEGVLGLSGWGKANGASQSCGRHKY